MDGLSEHFGAESINTLENWLHTLQRLNVNKLEEIRFITASETFAVSKCKYKAKVVAIKPIKLDQMLENFNRQSFY